MIPVLFDPQITVAEVLDFINRCGLEVRYQDGTLSVIKPEEESK